MARRLALINPARKRELMCDHVAQPPCLVPCRNEMPSNGQCRVYMLLKTVGGTPPVAEVNTPGGTTLSVPLSDNPLELTATGLCALANRHSGFVDAFPAVLVIDGNKPVPAHAFLGDYVLADDDSIRVQFRHLFFD